MKILDTTNLCLISFALLLTLTACDRETGQNTPPAKPEAVVEAEAQEPIQGHPDDWCGGHALPESMCTKCNPELTARFKAKGDWCEAHKFPKSACPVCNPMKAPVRKMATGKADDWCGGHALPESMCTKCNPELADGFKAKGDWCEAHSFPESACPVCNPMKAPEGRGGNTDKGAL